MRISQQVITYGTQPIDQVVAALHTSARTGLSTEQVVQRQQQYGRNQVNEYVVTWYQLLIRQITSPLLYIFIAIALLSLVLHETSNAVLIMLCVVVNIAFGFYQEYRAHQSAQSNSDYAGAQAQVLRDGVSVSISADQLVPGDFVLLYPGDIVPADMRIIQEEGLLIDESMLTGESELIKKVSQLAYTQAPATIFELHTLCFAGTNVVRGTATGVVISTGMSTVMGSIAARTTASLGETGLARDVKVLSRFIGILIILVLSVVLIGNIVIKGMAALSFLELLIFATALGISVIPEALPVVITFCFSQGARRLATYDIVVKRLAAIEILGGINMLCVDKTGTLTENKLTVTALNPVHDRRVIIYAALANESRRDKIAATAKGFDKAITDYLTPEEQELLTHYKRIKEIPFDPIRRDNRVIVEYEGRCEVIVRGMAEGILPLCYNLNSTHMQEMLTWISAQEGKGHRVIAIAGKKLSTGCSTMMTADNTQDIELIGCIAFIDPLKASAVEAITHARNLGVRIKIISGDSKAVCGAVAQQLGLVADVQEVLLGADFAQLSDEEKREAVERYAVFARILPDQKYEIIQYLKKHYQVGYVGDGINDVPALKLADVAIVVPDAADVARSIADFILMRKSLRVIINGIQEGRAIRVNAFKYIKITIAASLGNFYSLAIASLFVDYLPMQPVHLLLLNIITDFPLIAIATDTVEPEETACPRAYSMWSIVLFASFMGIISTVADFICFGIFKRYGQAVLQTSWFVFSGLSELACIVALRTYKPWYAARRPSYLLLGLLVALVPLMLIVPYMAFTQRYLLLTPLAGRHMVHIVFLALGYFVVTEIAKRRYYRFMGQERVCK